MSKITKAEHARIEQQKAIDDLRLLINPGDTIITKLVHVSRSGMYRVIDLYIVKDNQLLRLSWSVAIAIRAKYDLRHEGVAIGGCGMDMGFALVYDLGYYLFKDDERFTGKDAGYALNQRWI